MKVKEFLNLLDSYPETDITLISLSYRRIEELYKLDDIWLGRKEQGDYFDIDMDFETPNILFLRPTSQHIYFNGKRIYPKEESIKVLDKLVG